MKTSTNAFLKIFIDYLNEAIDCECLEISEDASILEKTNAVLETFRAEYGFRISQIGERGAFIEWLQGLPSYIDIYFYHNDIIGVAKRWGTLAQDASEKQEERICKNWFPFFTTMFYRVNERAKEGRLSFLK